MGVFRHQPSHPRLPKLKEVPKVLPQVTGVPVHLSSLRASHGPTGLYNDRKRSEADGPVKGKDLTWSNDNNMYLGQVVAAQQVLDPSPQNSYPWKEKRWGAPSLQPTLQESNPRV